MSLTSIKKFVFNNLSKTQKAEMCNFLKIFTQKNAELRTEDIIDKFLEEEEYYLKLNTSKHPWIVDFIDNSEFLEDLASYIKDCKFDLEMKAKQKPFLDEQKQKQKAFLKQQRKEMQEYKMANEKPTKKQKYYYQMLCKKYKLEAILVEKEEASKLDYKQAIEEILETYFKKIDTNPNLRED